MLELQEPEGKQQGEINPLIRIHFLNIPENGAVAASLVIISNFYIIFAMLFMQLGFNRWTIDRR